jgi:putative transcriptional regulator
MMSLYCNIEATMIRCNFSTMLGERKLKIIDVIRDTGIHRNTLTALYYDRAQRIELDSIEVLCRYFDCTIGEFLELADDSK